MAGSSGPSAELVLDAVAASVTPVRHHVVAFARSRAVPEDVISAVALAVTEVATNVVVHAYPDGAPGTVRVRCERDGPRLVVEVVDDGVGMRVRRDSPGLGHGLATVGALAQELAVGPGPRGRGTLVRMTFTAGREVPAPTGLDALCGLALALVADVCCLDRVTGGVLRREAAEVAGDAGLSGWLRVSTPPAKPGTATWAALRQGGARLVVHDPTVPRSPGGPGERLGLTWWVSIALDGPDGEPAALWGMGGREGGRPVPSTRVIGVLSDAARGDLSDPDRREALRARLA